MTPLRRRMIEDMRIRNLSPHTQTSLRRAGFPVRPPFRPAARTAWAKTRSGLGRFTWLEERRLAASSISVAVAALRFVYTVTLKKPWIVEGRHPNQPATEETPRCAEPGGGRPVPGRGGQPETSDDPDRLLRDGAAHFRGGFPEARRDRQPADGHSGGGGQRPEGPLRDALADAVGHSTDLLEGGPPERVAVSR